MKKQMREFIKEHSGENFTATSLARELGWKRSKKKKNFNTKSALRLAVKCGAIVERGEKEVKGKMIPFYDIVL